MADAGGGAVNMTDMSYAARLTDRHGRPLRDLRLSVTDQCNFRCSYCMPPELIGPDYRFLSADEKLSFAEIERLAKLFVASGVAKIRLTGGEPLLRPDLSRLAASLSAIPGLGELTLTTNGSMLGQQAAGLFTAGIRRVNVSLDAIDDTIFSRLINRHVPVSDVLRHIDMAIEAGMKVKVNAVIRRGWNEDQIEPLARYFHDRSIELRFIEFMDVGCSNGWDPSHVMKSAEILKIVRDMFPLEEADERRFGDVAESYRYADNGAKVGFISSVSAPFCGDCTRARLSSDGRLYMCLFAADGVDLRTPLRSGASDEALLELIRNAWSARSDRYSELRDELLSTQGGKPKIEMSYIGG